MYQMLIKGKAAVILVAAFSILFSGCSKEDTYFDGSCTSSETQFILDFEVMHKTLTHIMNLEANDNIDVIISRSRGELDIAVTDMGGNSIYRGDNASSGEFSLVINRNDSYEFKVTGRNASGFVSFIKR